MKTLIINSKSSLLSIMLLSLPIVVEAKLVGKVHAIKGDAFVMIAGKTHTLIKDMDIEEGSQLMVSDASQLTVGDFYDRRYHLSEGTHFVMHDRAATLQKGGLWVQSLASKEKVVVSSANMLMTSTQGEFVATYDAAFKRGQLTVITGEVDVASPQEPTFRYAVAAGFFSVASPQVDEGYPRSPTKLGYESLMKTVGLFPGVKSLDAGLAQSEEKKGQITYMKTVIPAERKPASVPDEAQGYFVKKTRRAPPQRRIKTAAVARVRIIGFHKVASVNLRKPASSQKVQSQGPQAPAKSSDFLESYQFHQSQQPKHTQEMQRLIDDLKSY